MSSQPMMLRISCTSGEKFILMSYKGSSLKDLRKSIESEFYSKYSFQGIRKAQVTAISDIEDYLIHQSLHGNLHVGDVFNYGETIKVTLNFSYEKEKQIEKMNESIEEKDSEDEFSSDEENNVKKPQIICKILSPSFFDRVSSDEEDQLETSESETDSQDKIVEESQEEEEKEEKEVEERMEEENQEEEEENKLDHKIVLKLKRYLVNHEKGREIQEIISDQDKEIQKFLKEKNLLLYFKSDEDFKVNGKYILLSPKFFKTKTEIIKQLSSILSKNDWSLISEIYPKLTKDDKKFIVDYYSHLKEFIKKHPIHFELNLESVKKK